MDLHRDPAGPGRVGTAWLRGPSHGMAQGASRGWLAGLGHGDNSVTTAVVQVGAEGKELELGLTGQVLGTVSPPPVGRVDRQLWGRTASPLT